MGCGSSKSAAATSEPALPPPPLQSPTLTVEGPTPPRSTSATNDATPPSPAAVATDPEPPAALEPEAPPAAAEREAPPAAAEPPATAEPEAPPAAAAPEAPEEPAPFAGTRIAIIYYSTYGHIRTLALEAAKGVEAAGGRAELLQCPETLPAAVLEKMGAPPKSADPLVTAAALVNYDGFLFGLPGRYGMFPAQFKTFWDSTGSLWQSGALLGKPYGCFFSTGVQGGGQETLGLATLPQMAHQGMLFVPIGYADARVSDNTQVHGCSAYGAGTIAGSDGGRVPSELELGVTRTQGERFTRIAALLAAP